MTKKEFKEKLLYCIFNMNTGYNNRYAVNAAGQKIYYNCGYNWGNYTTWDCWNWPKTILWGWQPGWSVGSFLYAPGKNGVWDWNGHELIEWCKDVSEDFKNIPDLDMLITPKEDHVGIYIGDRTWNGYYFNVAECTPKTDYMIGGCLLSYVDEQGRRFNHKGGKQLGSWAKHGTIPILEDDIEFTVVYEDEDLIIGKAKK